MATYVNDLRLKEIATGDESGTWGTSTNTNLELIAEAFSFGTEAITTNADTHTTTIADGSTDPGRSLYLKYTGTLDSACTITIGPNTVSKLWFIENGTSGSQNIIISQGSGANITIPPGDTKAIYSDGAGSGAAMVDAFASLSVVDLKVQDDLTVTDDMTVGGTLGVTGVLTATSLDISGDIDVDGTTNLDVVDIDGAVDMATTLTLAGNADFNGDLDVDGTTNLDVVDIDGALTATTATFSYSGTGDCVVLESTEAGASNAPDLVLYRNSSSPADSDDIGNILFKGKDDGGNDTSYAFIMGEINDASDGSEDGNLFFRTISGGSLDNRISIVSDKIGMGSDSPAAQLDIQHSGNDLLSMTGVISGGTSAITMRQSRGSLSSPSNSSANGDGNYIRSQIYRDSGYNTCANIGMVTGASTDDGQIIFSTALSGTVAEKMRIDEDGNVGIGSTSITNILELKKSSATSYDASAKQDGGARLAIFNSNNTTSDTFADIHFQCHSTSPGEARIGMELPSVSNSDLFFITESAGTLSEKMRIKNDGKVGINEASPTKLLSITSSTDYEGIIIKGAGHKQLTIESTQSSHQALVTFTTNSQNYSIGVDTDNDLTFHSGTAGSERMCITSGGKLFIGTTAAVRGSEQISIDAGSADVIACKTTAAGLIIRKTSFTNGFLCLFEVDSNGFDVGSITSDGSTVSYTSASDYRLKENIQPMTNGLDRVKQFNPVKFEWKGTGKQSEGFIAHEVDEIYSDCVEGEKDGERMQTMDYGKITPLLVKAIQEQQTIIDDLKTRIETLEG